MSPEGLSGGVKRSRHKSVCLAEHDNLVAAVVGEGLNPDAVLLRGASLIGVFVTQLVGPRETLVARTESERALPAVTGNNVVEGVGLRAVDR